jgi:hypothetical protein
MLIDSRKFSTHSSKRECGCGCTPNLGWHCCRLGVVAAVQRIHTVSPNKHNCYPYNRCPPPPHNHFRSHNSRSLFFRRPAHTPILLVRMLPENTLRTNSLILRRPAHTPILLVRMLPENTLRTNTRSKRRSNVLGASSLVGRGRRP